MSKNGRQKLQLPSGKSLTKTFCNRMPVKPCHSSRLPAEELVGTQKVEYKRLVTEPGFLLVKEVKYKNHIQSK